MIENLIKDMNAGAKRVVLTPTIVETLEKKDKLILKSKLKGYNPRTPEGAQNKIWALDIVDYSLITDFETETEDIVATETPNELATFFEDNKEIVNEIVTEILETCSTAEPLVLPPSKKAKIVNTWGYDTKDRQTAISYLVETYRPDGVQSIEMWLLEVLKNSNSESVIYKIHARNGRHWKFFVKDFTKALQG